MRVLLIICFVMQVFSINAQDKAALQGTWKIVKMHDSDMYYDVKTDSFSTKELEQLTPEQRKAADSAVRAQLSFLKAAMEASYMTFEADGTFKGIIIDGVDRSGVYTLNEAEKIITLNLKKEAGKDVDESDDLKYTLQGNRLQLLSFGGSNDMIVELEKK